MTMLVFLQTAKTKWKFCLCLSSFDVCFALTEKDFPFSVVHCLDCFLWPHRGSCLTNSLLIIVSKLVVMSFFHLHLPLCQPGSSGCLGILIAVGCSGAPWSCYTSELFWFNSDLWDGFCKPHGALPILHSTDSEEILEPSCALGYTHAFLPGFSSLLVSFTWVNAVLGSCSWVTHSLNKTCIKHPSAKVCHFVEPQFHSVIWDLYELMRSESNQL